MEKFIPVCRTSLLRDSETVFFFSEASHGFDWVGLLHVVLNRLFSKMSTGQSDQQKTNYNSLKITSNFTYLTLMKGLNVNSSAKVEGIVASPLSHFSYKNKTN